MIGNDLSGYLDRAIAAYRAAPNTRTRRAMLAAQNAHADDYQRRLRAAYLAH
jgi:hypothetical protein